MVDLDLDGTDPPPYENHPKLKADKATLMTKHKADPTLSKLYARIYSVKQARTMPICSYLQDGVLMSKWRPPDIPTSDQWLVREQPRNIGWR